MRAVLIAVATLLAVPALAQNSNAQPPTVAPAFRPNGPGPAPSPGAPSYPSGPSYPGTPPPPQDPQGAWGLQGTPVVMDREALMQQLANINEKLAMASGRAKKDRQLQKVLDDARAQLKEVGRQVSSAPLAQRPEPQRPPPPAPQPAVQPISEAMLRSLGTAIRNEPVADDQLGVLEEASATQYFLVSQAQQLLRLFSFSKDRLKAMRLLRTRLLDMENSYKLYESFEFSNDKDELKRILATQMP